MYIRVADQHTYAEFYLYIYGKLTDKMQWQRFLSSENLFLIDYVADDSQLLLYMYIYYVKWNTVVLYNK